MARNKYPGYCYCCGEWIEPGFGHFERYADRWRIKCVKCASGRTVRETDNEVTRVRKALKEDEKINRTG